MTDAKQYAAALDLAGTQAGLAVGCGSTVLLDTARPMRGRESAQLAAWVEAELRKLGLSLKDISRWSIGSGPGSFTGMRLAAALVSGWSYGKAHVEKRCIPTAVALAAATAPANDGETAGCIFDGRNREVIYFQLRFENNGWVPTGESGIYDRNSAESFFSGKTDDRLLAIDGEMAAIAKILPENAVRQLIGIRTPCYAALMTAEYRKFDGDLTDLVYIRPAVFTTPVNA